MTEKIEENQELAKKKLVQIYKYLQALDQLRNPVKKQIEDQLWTLWFKDLPQHQDILCDFLSDTEFPDRIDGNTPETYLTVRKPDLTSCPEPPFELQGWLNSGWKKIENEPEIIESIYHNQDEEAVELFTDDENRIAVYEEWLNERNQWRLIELPARKTMKIFEKLYSLYSWIERENDQVELILGDGILDWKLTKGISIHHPILLQKVRLLFDPNVPEFTLVPTEQTIEFFSALFRDVEEVSAYSVTRCTEDIEAIQSTPLGYHVTDDYLKRVISHLTAKGQFVTFGDSTNEITLEERAPFIQRNPVLFLRKRSLGFTNAIEDIIEDLIETAVLPEAVTRITGIDLGSDNSSDRGIFQSLDVNGENEDILFTKDANSEQLDIALKINKYGSVLVQGPPGTGKTHTIANLLGHFLAEGKSVLVTSHTSKALNVLRDKVAEPLQDLCVSVLDEEGGRNQLENSIDIITEKLNSLHPKQAKEDIRNLTQRRNHLLESIRKINSDLKHTRENDYRSIVFAGQEFEPSKAARLVSAGQEQLSIIPGEITLGKEFPFTKDEVEFLYMSTSEVSLEEEQEFQSVELHPQKIMTPEVFGIMVNDHDALSISLKDSHDNYWEEKDGISITELQNTLQQVINTVGIISQEHQWKLEIISAGKSGANRTKDWEELNREITELIELYHSAKSAQYKFGPSIEDGVELDLLSEVLKEVISYSKEGNKLNSFQLLLKPKWKKAIYSIKVNGQTPKEIDHFEAALVHVEYKKKRHQVFNRWKRQVTSIGGYDLDSLGDEPEESLEQIKNEIHYCLNWFQVSWSKQVQQLTDFGLQWEPLLQSRKAEISKHSELYHLKTIVENELVEVVSSYINKFNWNNLLQNQLQLQQTIDTYTSNGSLLVTSLKQAVNELDVSKYAQAYSALEELWGKNDLIQRRNHLLKKLEAVAPSWADAIRNREDIHGYSIVPKDLQNVWLLKQLDGELSRRASLSLETLQKELLNLRSQFKSITTQLVEKRAWLALEQKTTLKQQSALHGWKLLIKRAGKRTGIRAPHLLAEAKRLMPVCQTAVPVWIMPIHRVVESFNPAENQFDVVIIDEASQADVMALTALYLGKQVVVVGDDEQVSPEAIGQKQDEVQKLIDMHLQGIPNAALYDGQTSIYDLAKTSFAGMTQLREHFRCVEPIIQFSNHLSYHGRILPLRDSSPVLTRPFTIEYRVDGFLSGSKKNDVEAKAIVSLILAAIEQDAYKDATFGVITLLGEEQAILIDQYLQKYLAATEYKKRNIRCGNSAQFQGDERDIIFLSMVHSSDGDGPMRMLSDPGDRMKKRYNVAASRARNQLWLVHSLHASVQLKDGDLRKRLIEHIRNPYAVEEMLKQAEPKIQSEFERLVIQRLFQEGYKVTPQWKVGAYSIDMVVEGGGKKLAVECDGDRWHPIEKIGEDMARQAILERLGWTFVRIRGGEFFRNPENALIPLLNTLISMEIPRELHTLNSIDSGVANQDEDLKNAVIIRAGQIRKEWDEQKGEYLGLNKKEKVNKPKIESRTTSILESSGNEIPTPISPTAAQIYQQPELFEKDIVMNIKEIEIPIFEDTSVVADFELCQYLQNRNVPFIDKRDKGGALWVIGDKKIEHHFKDLEKYGIIFTYLPNGSQASRKKPTWYTKNQK